LKIVKLRAEEIACLHEAVSAEARMLWLFKSAGGKNKRNKTFQFWQQDNHPEELETNNFKDQKLEYIHMNPVIAGLVDEPEHYRWSSARDYAGIKGLVQVEIL
jgi:putative transposase